MVQTNVDKKEYIYFMNAMRNIHMIMKRNTFLDHLRSKNVLRSKEKFWKIFHRFNCVKVVHWTTAISVSNADVNVLSEQGNVIT